MITSSSLRFFVAASSSLLLLLPLLLLELLSLVPLDDEFDDEPLEDELWDESAPLDDVLVEEPSSRDDDPSDSDVEGGEVESSSELRDDAEGLRETILDGCFEFVVVAQNKRKDRKASAFLRTEGVLV